jgi:hypothetical protein
MRRTGARVAGFLLAGVVGFGPVAAWGGDTVSRCCSDLEDVLSSLTAAVTGAKKSEVSVRFYGQLNRAVMYWDDGKTSSTYAVDNETSTSRIGVFGKHRFIGDLMAGYRVEIDTRATLSSEVSRDDALGDLGDGVIRLRHAYWYVEDKKAGRLTLGQQSPASDDITLINLGAKMSDAALHYNNAFAVRVAGDLATTKNPVFRVNWGDLAHTVDTMRGLFVRYDTPTINGFLLSAAAGEDQVWDVALRYSDGPDWLRIAGGIGFIENQELGIRDVKGSFSALHTPTGLFATIAGGVRQDYGVTIDADRHGYFYFAQIGLTKRYFPFGATTVYGEFGHYNDFGVGRIFLGNLNLNAAGTNFRRWALLDSEVDRWGVGIEQEVERAGLLLYAQFHHYAGSFVGQRCAEPIGAGPNCTLDPVKDDLTASPWQAFVMGARIQF